MHLAQNHSCSCVEVPQDVSLSLVTLNTDDTKHTLLSLTAAQATGDPATPSLVDRLPLSNPPPAVNRLLRTVILLI
jgi:hypothetical protein